MVVQPVTLSGPRIDLVPLTLTHTEDLLAAASHDQVWTYLDEPTPATREGIRALILEALDEQAAGQRLPFAIVLREIGRAIGSMSYIDIQPRHRALELGWAWLAPEYWQTGIGREASYLLIRHAFERLDAVRVALKTDARNARSQKAIAGLGAVREGVFRRHRILRDGHQRDSVFYSLIREDWNAVRDGLAAQVGMD
ncbi:GNAT family protein [Streptomyces pseudoechinosporeus]